MRFYPPPTHGSTQGVRMQRSADSPDTLNLRGKVAKAPEKMRRTCPMCDEKKPLKGFEKGATLCKQCEKPGSGKRLLAKIAREEAAEMAGAHG